MVLTTRKPKRIPRQGEDLNDGVYLTPLNLLRKINRRYPIGFDLAADASNNVMRRMFGIDGAFFDAADNSLQRSWTHLIEAGRMPADKWGWCNPPFSEASEWVEKASVEASLGYPSLVLLPTCRGTVYFRDHVKGRALVYDLIGRAAFTNHPVTGEPQTYPKDLVLIVFDGERSGSADWEWQ